jgi:rare lipoprotein A
MAFLLKVRNLLLAGLLSMLLLAAIQEAAQAEPVLASYYGAELAGNPTASGEPFNPYDFSAAHPYLPFGTLLTVTKNGRSVNVRVNDRGPHVPGRGLDLSLGAAQAIGLTNSGAAVVDVDTAKTPEAKPPVADGGTTDAARPARTISSSKTIPSAVEPGEHHVRLSSRTLTSPAKQIVDSISERSSSQPDKVDIPYKIPLSSEAPPATRLAGVRGEQMAQTLYVRPASLRRRRGTPMGGVL